MKAFASLFLVIILLLQCSMKLGIVAYYEWNKEYITANFCENKANVNMKCNGNVTSIKKSKHRNNKKTRFPLY